METDDHDDLNKIHNPHDKLFLSTLRNHNIARDAMQAYLPKELLSQLNLNRLKFYKTKFVSPQMKEFQADFMYEIPFKETSALVLFHCEQESTPARTIPLKIWQYLFLVLMEYAENHPHQPLPITFPLVVYTGETEFHYSTYLFDLFGEHQHLAEKYFLQGITLVDVCRLHDEDIKKKTLFGLSEYAFKHKKNKDFREFLETAIPWLDQMELKIGSDYTKIYIHYIMDVFPESDYSLFMEKVKQHSSKKLEKKAMTIAEHLIQRGKQEAMTIAEKLIQQGKQEAMAVAEQQIQRGKQEAMTIVEQSIQRVKQESIQQGMQQGKIAEKQEIAEKMLLREEFSAEVIASLTGLTVAQINTIKEEIEHLY